MEYRYFTYGTLVPGDLLTAFPSSPAATVARVGILLSVTGSYPIFMFIVRKSVCKIVFGAEPTTLPFGRYLGVTAAIFLTSFAIAMSISALDTIVGFVGCTVGMMVGFTIPALIFVRLEQARVAAGSFQINAEPLLGGECMGNSTLPPTAGWKIAVAQGIVAISAVMIPVLVAVQIYMLLQKK